MVGFIEVQVKYKRAVCRRLIAKSEILYIRERKNGNASICTTYTMGSISKYIGGTTLSEIQTLTSYDEVIRQLQQRYEKQDLKNM